jgi:alpha-D-ribose 1-methylphosphonate 5-triphosphate diphosphatase PhnM
MKKLVPDPRAGMDIDAGLRIGDDARDQRRSQHVQAMREAVVDDRQHARIAEQHFVHVARRGLPRRSRRRNANRLAPAGSAPAIA